MNLEYIGSFFCHQIPERTIQIAGQYLPLCARCTGIYTGFLLGIFYQFILRQTKIKELPNPKMLLISALFIGFLIIDSLGSYLKLRSLSTYPRLMIGLLGGASISLFLYPVFNYSLFVKSKKDNGIKKWAEYSGLLLLLALTTLFILTGRFIAYNTIAFISIFSVLLLYLMINTTIAGRIVGWQNQRNTGWRNVFFLAGIVLILTVIEFYLFQKTHLKL